MISTAGVKLTVGAGESTGMGGSVSSGDKVWVGLVFDGEGVNTGVGVWSVGKVSLGDGVETSAGVMVKKMDGPGVSLLGPSGLGVKTPVGLGVLSTTIGCMVSPGNSGLGVSTG